MKTKPKKYRCGACGNDKYLIFKDVDGTIFTECSECNIKTRITFEMKLSEDNDDQDGIMCIF